MGIIGYRQRRILDTIFSYIVIGLLVLFFCFPIYWLISMSFKEPADVMSLSMFFRPTLDNYRAILFGISTTPGIPAPREVTFPNNLLNSLVIGLSATALALCIGTPAAYVLSRFNFKAKKTLSFYILSTRIVPPLGMIIPFYVFFSRLRLLDTRISLIIMYFIMNISLVVWMMRGFFDEIPASLDEAARIDGCSRLAAFWRIALPLTAPGLAATAIFCLLFSWNDFVFAIILAGNKANTAPVAVYSFVTFRQVIWGSLAAAGTLTALPVLVFVLLVQRHLVRGLTLGAIK
ncbi:MAG: carbohydrate ABC transporter permease [Firmicutes bacterium]|nr:carbohydrate ABC transporter permease [Bacillota bacterium]